MRQKKRNETKENKVEPKRRNQETDSGTDSCSFMKRFAADNAA